MEHGRRSFGLIFLILCNQFTAVVTHASETISPLCSPGEKRQQPWAASQLEQESIMNQEEQSKKINQLIAKCWSDESFKQRLFADPAATLKAEGVALPDGLSFVAVENTDKVFHLVIPAKPADLSDEELDKVAAGNSRWPIGYKYINRNKLSASTTAFPSSPLPSGFGGGEDAER